MKFCGHCRSSAQRIGGSFRGAMVIHFFRRAVTISVIAVITGCAPAPAERSFSLKAFLAANNLAKAISEELLLQPYRSFIADHGLENVRERWQATRLATDQAFEEVGQALTEYMNSTEAAKPSALEAILLSVEFRYQAHIEALADAETHQTAYGDTGSSLQVQFSLHRLADKAISLIDYLDNDLFADNPEAVLAVKYLSLAQIERAIQTNKMAFHIPESSLVDDTTVFLGTRTLGKLDVYWAAVKDTAHKTLPDSVLEDHEVLRDPGTPDESGYVPFFAILPSSWTGRPHGVTERYREYPAAFYIEAAERHFAIQDLKQAFIEMLPKQRD